MTKRQLRRAGFIMGKQAQVLRTSYRGSVDWQKGMPGLISDQEIDEAKAEYAELLALSHKLYEHAKALP